MKKKPSSVSAKPVVESREPKPRSGSGQRATFSDGLESRHGTSKKTGAIGSTNRKRSQSTQSSSPPVAQWGDRRPHKIPRTARRTKLVVPAISSKDEVPASSNSDITAEIRSRDNGSKSEEVQKMSTLVHPTRKNKFLTFSSARSFGKVGKVKQLKTISKLGRPPTRKLSGRKVPRQKYSTFATTEFLSTDDGHEELLAAANAVINPGCALSSPFWRQMDPLFSFVSDTALAYVKQELTACYAQLNGTMSFEPQENGKESPEYLTLGSISMCQRLLTGLISEEDNNYDLKFNVYGSSFDPKTNIESYAVNRHSLQNFELDGSHIMDRYQYSNMSIDERSLVEIHSLGLYPSRLPDLVHPGDEDVSNDISRLQEKHNHQVSRKKSLLNKLLKSAEEARELQAKDFERISLEKLTGMAYQKYMRCWGPSAPGGKGAGGKMAKKAALDCVKRTLDRCHEFEATGKSCFAEPRFREMFLSGLSRLNDGEVDGLVKGESGKVYGTHMKKVPSDSPPFSVNHPLEQPIFKDNVWSSKVKKRELYLDDRKGNGPRNGIVKGERKTKAKLKQKTTQLSVSKSTEIRSSCVNEKRQTLSDNLEEPLDLSHLQLPGMDDFGGRGEDIGSWLNIEDDVLQDDDFMGLEIPMDDLTDLNMMV